MEEITYCPLTATEIPAWLDLRMTFVDEYCGQQPEETLRHLRNNTEAYLRKSVADKSFIAWLAKAGSAYVGLSGLIIWEHPPNLRNPFGRSGYFHSMYTSPSYRRRGICTGLLDRLISTANEMGVHVFDLHATPEGEAVYRKYGFELNNEPSFRLYSDTRVAG